MDYAPPARTQGQFTGDGPLSIPVPFTVSNQIGRRDAKQVPTAQVQEDIRKIYDEEILEADQAVGTLVDGIKAAGRWDNTTLVITSDHGEEFWDHGGFEHGHSLLGELTRVPLIVSGRGPQQGRVDAVVEHVDLFQALVHHAGLSSPAGTSGSDLFALATDKAAAKDRVALSENTLYGPPMVSMVDANFRLELNQKTGGGGVYQVQADGSEIRVDGEAPRLAGQRLVTSITERRGDLKVVEAVSGPKVPSFEVFEQLKALGYLEGDASPPVPTAPQDPAVGDPGETAPRQ